ncbi:MAG: hypothetical protein U1E73_04260 [Planctomycetota bacterium]
MMRPVLFAALLLAGVATAQRGPLPGIPLVPPPVPHPALAAQPLIQPEAAKPAPARPAPPPAAEPAPPTPAEPTAKPKPAPIDPDTMGPKASGKDLKKAVAKVTKLKWYDKPLEAEAMSAATGKPVLWLQALGDLDGFA